MKALVTGGAGFIGSHIVDALLARGAEVRVVDNLLQPVHLFGKPDYLPAEVEFLEGSAADYGTMKAALQGVDVVFHQAAYQGFLPDFSTFFATNTVSTALLLELIVTEKLPVGKVVVASSQAVYGEGKHFCGPLGNWETRKLGNSETEHSGNSEIRKLGNSEAGPSAIRNPKSEIRNPKSEMGCGVVYPPPRPLEQLMARQWEVRCPECGAETRPLLTDEGQVDPNTQYAMSKYTQEMVGIRLGQRHGIPVSALRYSITQGPRQSFFNAYSGILRIFSLRMMNDKRPVAYEDGLMQRDYVHVRDVVAANLLCLDDPRTDYEAYNVGSGKATTVLEYAEALARVLGKEIAPEVPGEFRLGDVRHIISDVSKLQALGWQVTADLETIIRDYVAWVETFADLDDYFAGAEKVLKESGAVRRTEG